MVEFVHRFPAVIKTYWVVKNCLYFAARIKCVLYLIIGCICEVIQLVIEFRCFFMVVMRICNI